MIAARRDAARPLKRSDRDRDVVEDAESLAVVGKGVVRAAGEVDRDAVERAAAALDSPADGAKRSLDERRRPRKSEHAQLGLGQRALVRRRCSSRVDERELLDRRARGARAGAPARPAPRRGRVAEERVLRDRKSVPRRQRNDVRGRPGVQRHGARARQGRAAAPVPGSLYTTPSFITKSTRSATVTSRVMSPGTATTSASLPAASVPMRLPAQQLRGVGRPRDDRLHRRQAAPLDEQAELVPVGPVRDHAGVGAQRDRHAVGLRDLDAVPHRRRGRARLLRAQSREHAVLRRRSTASPAISVGTS